MTRCGSAINGVWFISVPYFIRFPFRDLSNAETSLEKYVFASFEFFFYKHQHSLFAAGSLRLLIKQYGMSGNAFDLCSESTILFDTWDTLFKIK